MTTYYRGTRGTDTPVTDVPWTMWAESLTDVEHYGASGAMWSLDVAGVRASALADDIVAALAEAMPDQCGPDADPTQDWPESIKRLIDPSRIVDSAGVWDNHDAVQVIYDVVLAPRGIEAVETQDGMIYFGMDGWTRMVAE